ncbi:threonine synthase [Candidatus Gottesmanbacteria bacterium]|nr:threonine synthase [Candidatus Gottesmanbacteria bacterium]
MRYYSTNDKTKAVSLKDAVTRGLAPDGGLYMPETIPKLPTSFFQTIHEKSLHEIAHTVASAFIGDDVPGETLRTIVADTLNFQIPLVQISDDIFPLELFHGPTMAFKDVGARFMARLLAALQPTVGKEMTVLVATSGDTGSAVASGFLNVPGIRVVILYPSKRVSDLQEKQLTTMGGNITALEVEGSFDDCQRMVKEAFQDEEIRQARELTSANSINIARLIPQAFYYFWAYTELPRISDKVVISVPSGNFGNLSAGLFAKHMGLPVDHFVAATNVNDIVPKYLNSGVFETRPSQPTISNAMDVGSPSNFSRMLELYDHDVERMRGDIIGMRFTDDETREAIRDVYNKYGYVMDPHGAVGYLGLRGALHDMPGAKGIFLETAHPAKFLDTVKSILGIDIEIPEQLRQYLNRKKEAVLVSNNFIDLKKFLLS